MKKLYAQKDADGKLTATIMTAKVMESPWVELSQNSVGSDWVWDEATSKFVEPEPTPDP